MFDKVLNTFKGMPAWQKGLTVVGVATVGITITMLTTKGVKYSWNKYQDYKQKKELGNKLDELSEVAKNSGDPVFEKMVNDLVNDKLVKEMAGKPEAKIIDINKAA